MELRDMIACRKSVRQYTGEAVDEALLAKIQAFRGKALIPDIRTQAVLLDASQVRCLQKWKTPHFLALYSEEKFLWLENAGFVFQQLDLFIQSLGLGSCWVGLGSVEDDSAVPQGMKLVCLMPFGVAKENPRRASEKEFNRKAMAEITDQEDPRLACARLAPSATNDQPWFFRHEGDVIHCFRILHGAVKRRALEKFNQVDMGIALAHLYVTHPERFAFFRQAQEPEKAGYLYTGSIRL